MDLPTRCRINRLFLSVFWRMSTVLKRPKSEALFPVNNSRLKNARSLASMYLSVAERAGSERRLRMWRIVLENLSKKSGVACLVGTRISACSFRIDWRYCDTEKCAAGFPDPVRASKSPERSRLLKIARSLPIVESTVPAARRVGQGHEAIVFEENN